MDKLTAILVEVAIENAFADELDNTTELQILQGCVYLEQPKGISIDVRLKFPEQRSLLEYRTRTMRQAWDGQLYILHPLVYRLRLHTLPPDPFSELARFVGIISKSVNDPTHA